MAQLTPLTLKYNFSWTFIGNAVYAGCQWGMLVVMAKLGSPEMVGQFTLGLAVTAPVMMFTNLQLRAVQATDAKQQYLFSDYLGLRLLGTTIALVVIATIALISGYQWQTSLIILLVGLAKAFESISDVYYGLIQQHERMDRIAMSLMIKGSLSLLFLGMGVYISGNLVWGVVGLILAWAFVLIGYDIPSGVWLLKTSVEDSQSPSHNRWRPRWHLKTLAKLSWLSLPLGLVMMLISLNDNIPRYLIKSYLGERSLGIFASMAYLMVAGNMVVLALGQSASPRLAKYYAQENSQAFRTLLIKLVAVGAFLGGIAILVALLAGREILTLFYKPEYAEHSDILIWLMLAAAIGYIGSFLGYGITATRAFSYFLLPYLMMTGITAIASVLLIPTYGLIGATWALCAANVATCIMPIGILVLIHKGKQS
ncbi:polysaccharide biosynthesis protein [Tolypothrix tenuis PCC 7101]|uniref:Polysaccharide biosynthesis protein n=1 Tax=Tolypothrix tenuis PCC 7101 TaxID=231146 RepID=A0A1Z4N4M0_9CYAN|nr:oligosaccharide flippase family protein [Aulosira sp. FACHB-113]BAZ00602.1 polysaccharide biosynthesis protein [Tolypothrix tenuis PCC 7101]BAZ75476.1 polysaccharide biosynthesis protein [Aulosira laxa NIES-50]